MLEGINKVGEMSQQEIEGRISELQTRFITYGISGDLEEQNELKREIERLKSLLKKSANETSETEKEPEPEPTNLPYSETRTIPKEPSKETAQKHIKVMKDILKE